MKSAEISVIMPTYNHERFVGASIDSVLNQTGVDLELLIADDGSPDGTRDVVSSYTDDRIKFFPYLVNRGAGIVTNELISAARGKYIALINSDDVWVEGKLEQQLRILESNPDIAAVFGRAEFIDKDGAKINADELPFGSVFNQHNRTSGEWLRHFFAHGNCICHPTMLIRRSVFDELGAYNNRLRQLPDLEMWVRVVKKYKIFISDQVMVKFRILPGENASSDTGANHIRTMNEHFLIAEMAMDHVDRELFLEGFGDIAVIPDVPSDVHLDIEKALLYFHENQWLSRPYKLIGVLKMRKLLDSDVHREVMARDYGIGDYWYHLQTGAINVLRPPPPVDYSQLSLKELAKLAVNKLIR